MAGRLRVERLTKRAVLENTKAIGFQPGTIIDVGFAVGTEGLHDVFEGVRHVLIDPVAEAEPAMKAFCDVHPGSLYFVAAASDNEKPVTIVTLPGITGSSAHRKYVESASERRVTPAITLDRIAAENDLPYLIKIDVEGHELAVLKGATQCLKDAEMVIMEIGTWAENRPKGRPSMMDLFRFMEDAGFVFYEFVEPGYRSVDDALYMFDAVFVKTDSALRQVRTHKTPGQREADRLFKEARVRNALKTSS